MRDQESSEEFRLVKRSTSVHAFRSGIIGEYLNGAPCLQIGDSEVAAESYSPSSQALVFSGYQLQDIPDYRGAIQAWFELVSLHGALVIVVPHAFLYERYLALPSKWNPKQRRLYTPASLMNEVEEALAPNSYRVLFLGDDDREYDYAIDKSDHPAGRHDVVVVLRKIAMPTWALTEQLSSKPGPDFEFEAPRTRVETLVSEQLTKLLVLKLDHLGDFLMGVPALEKLRAGFPKAHITLVVGSWNRSLADGLGLFEEVIAFDAFPRNSSEEEPNVLKRVPAFDALIKDAYDMAIDLRTDPDTRILLKNVRARSKAGLGLRAQFDFLDTFLPIDSTRGPAEAARETSLPLEVFSSSGFADGVDSRYFARATRPGRLARSSGVLICVSTPASTSLSLTSRSTRQRPVCSSSTLRSVTGVSSAPSSRMESRRRFPSAPETAGWTSNFAFGPSAMSPCPTFSFLADAC